MVLKLSHVVVSFLVFATLTTLVAGFYTGLQTHYGITKNDTDVNGNDVMDRMNKITILSGINQSVSGIYAISNPTGAKTDILGALAAAGIGVIKIVTGIIVFPIQIIGAITDFYFIPDVVAVVLGLVFIIYLAFVLLNNYTRGDN